MNRAARWVSYGLRLMVAFNAVLFLIATYRADDRLFDRVHSWMVETSFAVVLIALVGLLSKRTWKSKIIGLLFAIPAVAILYFISISSIPGI